METHEFQAAHLGEAFRETRSACRDAVRKTPSLVHVAHYSRDVFDFSVDTFDENTRRDPLHRLGRRIGFAVTELDRALQEPRTGTLIRAVVHTERGALFCESVVPREMVVGMCASERQDDEPLSEMPDVRAADKALSALVTQLRARISLQSQDPGGWTAENEVKALTSADPMAEHRATVAEDVPDAVLRACRDAVRPQDLHYVAYCEGGAVLAELDQFDHPSLAPFFSQITVGARRAFYRGFTQELGTIAQRFNRLASSGPPGGLLIRLVLDVEQGAIYYYRLSIGSYLVGVTVDQSRVVPTDDRLAALAIELMAR
ncbi:hypothetical protein [Lentzea sp. CA-135723]|uniref:hypothetical protein n=1 Tax=Lentzea sp. CA-135723 TaxID=3239950 RepID=UPI003D933308